jgi:hypothetical protein
LIFLICGRQRRRLTPYLAADGDHAGFAVPGGGFGELTAASGTVASA